MLIRFRVNNFLSFNQQVELSMLPGKARQHPGHVVRDGSGRNDIDILKAAVIYGANASGKSNLIKAMAFARGLIISGTKTNQTIQVRPFKLDPNCLEKPAKFEFEIKQQKKSFLYGFELDSRNIVSEWLYEIRKTTETMLFERNSNEEGKTKVTFGTFLKKKKDKEFLEFVARGTRPNQLFLTESVDRDVDNFRSIYDWFKDVLIFIFPETRSNLNIQATEGNFLAKKVVDYLEKFDTGVCGFELVPVDLKNEIPEIVLSNILEDLKPGHQGTIMFPVVGEYEKRAASYYLTKDKSGEIRASKLMLKHTMGDCNQQTLLEMGEESDGTIRLMDLIPILDDLAGNNHVYVIDELDRSLHPTLSHDLIKIFLQNQSGKSQIIATTHEATLLDLELLRRDEIWFVQKDNSGASSLYSLEDFSPRYDKDIAKGYLLGRFGAKPMVRKLN